MSWQFSDQCPLTSSQRHHLRQAPRVVIFLLQTVGHIVFPSGPRGYRHCRTCFGPRRSSRRYAGRKSAMNRMRPYDRSDPIDAWRRRIQRPESNPLKLPLQQNGIWGFQRRWTCRLPRKSPRIAPDGVFVTPEWTHRFPRKNADGLMTRCSRQGYAATAARASSRSRTMSSADSKPMESRTTSGPAPAARRCSSLNCRWVVEAG
jgi:hypothetical protein